MINIDGLPVIKGGEKNVWPILCRVTNSETDVFPIGIFEGQSKPKCFNEFLKEFVEELNAIIKVGVILNGTHHQVRIHAFIMDAPATASTMFVAPYNGYNGCRKCSVKGEYFGKVVFDDMCAPLRTDDSFRSGACVEHHTGTTVLENLNINMVEDFPLDPMHLLYLGVVKKMIGQWMERRKGGLASCNCSA